MNTDLQFELPPSIKEILDYWLPLQANVQIFFDIREPACWSCKQNWNGKYWSKPNSKKAYEEFWQKAPLQRCHIVPKSLGGINKPENLLLMCKECHDLAPNTAFPQIMFKWMANQNTFKRFSNKVLCAMSDFEIDEADFVKVMATINDMEFIKWARDKSGLHWPQSGYSGTANKFTVSTMIGLMKHYWDMQRV
jgi:HNH endonuclease